MLMRRLRERGDTPRKQARPRHSVVRSLVVGDRNANGAGGAERAVSPRADMVSRGRNDARSSPVTCGAHHDASRAHIFSTLYQWRTPLALLRGCSQSAVSPRADRGVCRAT